MAKFEGSQVLLIVNEQSRQGGERGSEVERLLVDHGADVRRVRCPSREDIADAIRRHADVAELVVIGGGDGTINAAAPALVETKLPLGILPLGTANDLARTLGIPNDLAGAADIIAKGERRAIDVGDVNGILFFNVASIGLSVDIARALSTDVKRRFGTLGYAIATIRALMQTRPFKAELSLGDIRRQSRSMQLAVGNGRYYGGGLMIAENADIDDGYLDFYSLETDKIWKLALIYPAFRRGRHGVWNEVRTASCSDITIATRRPRSVNTDGEITTTTPARFRLLDKAITVIVPSFAPK